MRRKLRIGAAAAVGAILVSFTAPAGAGAAERAAAVPTLDWQPCGAPFQCATARVPLDYDRPAGHPDDGDDELIPLALIRLPASDHAHRIGSLFVNPGGPGASGVDFVRDAAQDFPPPIRARFDIVGFDPRGVARSNPIRCFPSNDAENRFIGDYLTFPVGPAETAAFISAWTRYGRICARHNAEIMQHMATADVARDLDLLRRAVGDSRLNYLGVSGGTYIGETYANLFPDRVGALVLDSVVDPVAFATGRGGDRHLPVTTRLRNDVGAEATLDQFLLLCDRAGPACAFSGGDPHRKLETLLALLPRHRAEGSPTYADVITVLLEAMYEPAAWPDAAQALQALFQATQPATAQAQLRALGARLAAPAPYDNSLDALYAIWCTDSENPDDPFTWPRAAAQASAGAPHFAAPWTFFSQACATWPAKDDDRYLGPFTTKTSSPVLLVNNRFDPATPYRGAQVVTGLLQGSRLLTLDGWGHVALGRSACIDGYVISYLVGVLPPVGATCRPDVEPFAAGPNVASASGGPASVPGHASLSAALRPHASRVTGESECRREEPRFKSCRGAPTAGLRPDGRDESTRGPSGQIAMPTS